MPRITITVEGKVPQPYRFDLARGLVTFGRDVNNDILVDCGSVSMHHAVMQRVHGGYELMDKGSTNGIKLNGECRQVIDLKNDQAVMIGDVVFDFVLSEQELAELARESSSSASPVETAPHLPPLPKVKEPSLPSLPAWPDEEDAELEVPVTYAANKRPPTMLVAESRTGGGFNILAGVLAVIAFVIGMEIHYRNDTGSSMIGRIHHKLMDKSPGAPVEDSSTAPK